MCGIAGIWNFGGKKVALNTLRKFTDSMIHRGPDGADYKLFDNEKLGLGHRRLAILDLSEAGKQPMSIDNERYWITYNGEVYNFIEIKEELKTLGYHFQSETDTEVILTAYKHWGKSCLDKFNGEWAFAIWDNEIKELFLARDRFGIKPFYFTSNSIFFAFASEVLAFKHLEGFNYSLNNELVNIQTKDNYVLDGKGYTIVNEVFSVLPGHYCIINSTTIQQQRWYDIRTKIQPSSLTYNEQVIKLKTLLFDAVKIRLRSDVAIGCALSGGLDSSSIYGVLSAIKKENTNLSRLPKDWQKAYVQTFPNAVFDEKKYAEKVVEYCNGSAEYLIHNQDNLVDNVIKTTQHCQRISSTPILSITDIYKNMKAKGVSVSIDGHGVDEMLFGYLGNVYDLYNLKVEKNLKKEAQNIADCLANLYSPADVAEVKNRFTNDIKHQFSVRNRVKRFLKNNRTNTENKSLKSLSDSTYNFSEEEILKTEFFEKTLPTLLATFDIAAMYSSVEIRMPFMDHRIVEFIFSLHENAKIGEGKTKRILRDAIANLIPNEIKDRTYKIGISAPLNNWINTDFKRYIIQKYGTHKILGSYTKHLQNSKLGENETIEIWENINKDLLKVE